MENYEKIAAKPKEFNRLYGLSYGLFESLLKQVATYIEGQKQAYPLSKRGRKSGLGLADQLLLALVYLRQYQTFLSVGHQFGISESYAQKRFIYIRNILMKVIDLPDAKLLTFDKLTTKVGIDVSEQPIERPLKNQKQYYSGKKKAYHQSFSHCLFGNGLNPRHLLWKGTFAGLFAFQKKPFNNPSAD